METRRMCPQCRAFITVHDRVCPYCDAAVGPSPRERFNPGELVGGLIPHARFVTVMLLVVNFGLYVATMLYSLGAGNSGSVMDLDGATLLRFGAKEPARILLGGQWWRLVTAGFLHGGLIHIFMNMWVLFDLGQQVEEVYGASRYIVIYLVSSVGGFVLSTYLTSALSVGASAGLFGLIGAMIALGVRHRSSLGAAIRGMYIRWAIYGLLFGLLPFFHVDNAAHIGGLATGFVCAYLSGTQHEYTRNEQVWVWAARVALAVTLFAFFKMYLSFSHDSL